MSNAFHHFDVIVIGGGHAGRNSGVLEVQLLAASSARGGSRGQGDLESAGWANLVSDGAGKDIR